MFLIICIDSYEKIQRNDYKHDEEGEAICTSRRPNYPCTGISYYYYVMDLSLNNRLKYYISDIIYISFCDLLMKIENEYNHVQESYREKGIQYVKWAADMATGLYPDVPWIMCKQKDAPANVVSFISIKFILYYVLKSKKQIYIVSLYK